MRRLALVAALAGAASGAVPASFNVQEKWYGCGLSTLNQGQCGSCWAVSATGVFGERMCIFFAEDGTPINSSETYAGNRLFQKAGSCTGDGTQHMAHNHGCKRTQYFLSPQAVMSCGTITEDKFLYPDSAGCNGGEARDAWRFFFVHGLSSMTADGEAGCTPYTSGKCSSKDPLNNGCKTCKGVLTECEDTGLQPKMHRVDSYGWIMEEGLSKRDDTSRPRPANETALMAKQVEKMQIELMTNGPLHVCIDYFENFGKFFNNQPLGIYNSTEGGPKTGGHCLSVIGWGTDATSGLDYWLIKNSWGGEWGSNGVFRFLRGADLCGIESDVWVGCPEGSDCELTAGVVRMESRRPQTASPVLLKSHMNELVVGQSLERSQRAPSATWRGGFWHQLPRAQFKALRVPIAHAFEAAFGEPAAPETAVASAAQVWTRGGTAQGTLLRVRFHDGREVEHMHLH